MIIIRFSGNDISVDGRPFDGCLVRDVVALFDHKYEKSDNVYSTEDSIWGGNGTPHVTWNGQDIGNSYWMDNERFHATDDLTIEANHE